MFRYELMRECWDQHPDHRPAFSKITQNIEVFLTGIAGYLSLDAITGFVQDNSCPDVTEVKGERLKKSDSDSSLNLIKHDIVTPVGISIHLEPDTTEDGGNCPTPTDLTTTPKNVTGEGSHAVHHFDTDGRTINCLD